MGMLEEIAEFSNLYKAYRKARRGKRHRESVDRFTFHLERELIRLQSELLSETYRPGPFVTFEIKDPKPRTIHAAPFRDRVLHHAILNIIEAEMERRMDDDSYACRKGKGLDAALSRARALSRRGTWVLRSDIRKCFDSIPIDPCLKQLSGWFPDSSLARLIRLILEHGIQSQDRRGLPIGSLTSQWFANTFLGKLDSYVRHTLKPKGYLRYMDDFALIADSKNEAIAWRYALSGWVSKELSLELNERVTQVYRLDRGWPFLGFRVSPWRLEVRRETWRRFQNRHRRDFHDWRQNRRSLEDLSLSTQSRLAHLDRASSRNLRRRALLNAEL